MRSCLPALAFFATHAFAQPAPQDLHLRVTVTNGTAGNLISPFVVALHEPTTSLFSLGMPASPGLALIAETGDASLLTTELDQAMRFHSQAAGGPLQAGESRSVELTVPAAQRAQRLSLVAMIGRSNDSFIALNGFDLGHFKGKVTLPAQNYDAGSEENTGHVEDFGAGGHPTAQAEGKVSFDRGLNPRGNAPESWAWGPVAAQLTIEVLP